MDVVEWARTCPGIEAVLVVGSSSQPFRDMLSDTDIEVIYSPAFVDHRRYMADPGVWAHPLDIQWISSEEFLRKQSSLADVDHWPYESCTVAWCPSQEISCAIGQLSILDESVRQQRIRLHYFEFLFGLRHFRRAYATGEELNARLTISVGLLSLMKVFFLVNGRYPALAHWAASALYARWPEMSKLGANATQLLQSPTDARVEDCIQQVDLWLNEKGFSFQWEKTVLTLEVVGETYRECRVQYGSW